MGAIEIHDLTKTYGDVRAVDGLSMTVEEGEIFGFLGPNGAGKTTTIRALLGLSTPTAGSASVLGADVQDERALIDAKSRLGYLPDSLAFDEQVTGTRVLEYYGSLRDHDRHEELLEFFNPPLDRPIREYSAGNRRMLGILIAFMHDPDLVIMDEPTTGLDPLKQDHLHAFLEEERARGRTIFFSSHVLSEVQRVCDRVGILREGTLVALEDVDTLLTRSGKRVRLQLANTVDLEVFDTPDTHDLDVVGGAVQFTYTGRYNELIELIGGCDLVDVDIRDPELEDVFMHYYGSSAPDSGAEVAND